MEKYNPNIPRITFEQIQELSHLELYSLVPGEQSNILFLAYNVITKKFEYVELSSGIDGSVSLSVVNNIIEGGGGGSLDAALTVQTNKLSLPEGFVLEEGLSLSDVMRLLTNPPNPAVFITNVTLNGTAETLLLYADTSYSLVITSSYTPNDRGAKITNSEAYFKNGVSIPTNNPVLVKNSLVGSYVFKTTIDVEASASFPAATLESEKTIKIVYPYFKGFSPTSSLGAGGINFTPNKSDIEANKRLELTFGNPGNGYYWFAIHPSLVPTEWITLQSVGGPENSGNTGLMTGDNSIWDKTDNFYSHNGIQYTFYMSKVATTYDTPLIIKF